MNSTTTKKINAILNNNEISKSAKIRALNEISLKRGEIAKLLGIRYQFVRNVLEKEIAKGNENK